MGNNRAVPSSKQEYYSFSAAGPFRTSELDCIVSSLGQCIEMKYGVNTMVWTTRVGKEQQPLLPRIRDWGFDDVELFLSAEEPADIPQVKKMLDTLGLERTACSVLPREVNLISRDPQVRSVGREYLQKCVERTEELGARLICGPL